jgi:hypothetical protein
MQALLGFGTFDRLWDGISGAFPVSTHLVEMEKYKTHRKKPMGKPGNTINKTQKYVFFSIKTWEHYMVFPWIFL